MNHDEITAMAEEAGFGRLLPAEMAGSTLLPATWVGADQRKLERFAALVAAKEREAIAAHYAAQPHVEFFGAELAEEIRARGQKEGV